MSMHNRNFYVDSEIGTLKRLLIHSPDGGIGKIIPSTFADNLYDDIVHLRKMQAEYNEYVRLLLYFVDPEKSAYVNKCLLSGDPDLQKNCFIPGKPEYFNSDKVLEAQQLLARMLENENVCLRLVTAICSYEETGYRVQQKLESIADKNILAKVLITGILPAALAGEPEDQFIFPPIPNFIFTRDIAIMIKDHILLSRMATTARKRESVLSKYLAIYCLFPDHPEKVIEIVEDSDYFLYEVEERREQLISIEGGDIMMIHPQHLLVGCSERTSENAVNEIVHTVFSKPELGIEKISVVRIPKKRAQMHVDTIFTQVKRNVWVLYGKYSELLFEKENIHRFSYLKDLHRNTVALPAQETTILRFEKPVTETYNPSRNYLVETGIRGLEGLLRDISVNDFGCTEADVKIIYSGDNVFPYDDREQWTDSCNVVALKEGVVIGYDRNDRTSNAFAAAGFSIMTTQEAFNLFENGADPHSLKDTLILLPSSELSRGRGGSHCMSMPLLREPFI